MNAEKTSESDTISFLYGRTAALRGCFRILVCPASKQQEKEWLHGYDSVIKEDRGKWPRTGEIPDRLKYLYNNQ